MRRRVLIAWAAVILALLSLPLIWFDALPFREATFARIRTGMGESAVREILGAPSQIASDGKVWSYSLPYAWPIALVRFDEQGKVESTAIDR